MGTIFALMFIFGGFIFIWQAIYALNGGYGPYDWPTPFKVIRRTVPMLMFLIGFLGVSWMATQPIELDWRIKSVDFPDSPKAAVIHYYDYNKKINLIYSYYFPDPKFRELVESGEISENRRVILTIQPGGRDEPDRIKGILILFDRLDPPHEYIFEKA